MPFRAYVGLWQAFLHALFLQRTTLTNVNNKAYTNPMTNIAIFVSGSGTNCENIIRHFADDANVHIALVLSNKPDAYALVRAKNHHVPTAVLTKAEFNDETKVIIDDSALPCCCFSSTYAQHSSSLAAKIRWERHVWAPCSRGGEGRRRERNRHHHPLGERRLRCWRDCCTIFYAFNRQRYARRYCRESTPVGASSLSRSYCAGVGKG